MCASDLSIWNICSESSGCVHSASPNPSPLYFSLPAFPTLSALPFIKIGTGASVKEAGTQWILMSHGWCLSWSGYQKGRGRKHGRAAFQKALLLDFRGLLSFYRSGILPFILQPPLRRLAREKTLKKNGPITGFLTTEIYDESQTYLPNFI